MFRIVVTAAALAFALAGAVQAEQTRRAGGGASLTAQIDGITSGTGRGTFASEGGLGTTR